MRLTTLIATLTVVTAVDPALTTKSVQSVSATLEILVSVTLGCSNYLHNKYFSNVKAKLEPCFNLIYTRSKANQLKMHYFSSYTCFKSSNPQILSFCQRETRLLEQLWYIIDFVFQLVQVLVLIGLEMVHVTMKTMLLAVASMVETVVDRMSILNTAQNVNAWKKILSANLHPDLFVPALWKMH